MSNLDERTITPKRILALALISAVALALVYLRFAPGEEVVSVPRNATAGDLTLEPCSYPTEDGEYAADCGTLVVPEDRLDPNSRLIALPVVRIKARSPNAGEPVFPLWGGPGLSNMNWSQASRFAEDRDVVIVGYRGVDGSARLACPEVDSAMKHSGDSLAEDSARAYADGFRSCVKRLTKEGFDLTSYGLAQQVDDMEAVRTALGYERINLLSESAGTRTALIYAWRYPGSIHRSVMVGVNPPGNFLWDEETTTEQIDRYAEFCAKDNECRERTGDLTATMEQVASHMPDRWLFLPIRQGNVAVFSFFGLMESTSKGMLPSGPAVLDSWLSAADGDAGGLWLQSFFGDVFPVPFVWGQYAAAARPDAIAVRNYFSEEHDVTNIGYATTAFAWGNGLGAETWPPAPDENEYSRVRSSEVETLLIGGTLDFSTPPQIATRELLPHLPNGHQVILEGFGHTATFWGEQPAAGTRLINTFLESGRIDDSLYEPMALDFTPEAALTDYAKRVVGIMLGLVLVAVLSLLWMVHRVRKRGPFGGIASVMLRTLYPIVVGVGGWFAGVLITLTVMPRVPVDDGMLIALSVGIPIGLGIYLAWMDREWTERDKRSALIAAVGTSLLGAFLGTQAVSGFFSVVTGVTGSIAGGNLALVLRDISVARRHSDRSEDTPSVAPRRQLEPV